MALTHEDLKSTLWDSANILRGSAVDRTDWKAYILPLLFFKRICDVWDEETAEAAELFGDVDPVDFPEVHRFDVPEGCHWRDVRETPANVGAALSHAMREIERANPDTLYRVFGAADWGNREMLTDEILKDLIEGLSEVSLGNTAVSTDVLGDAYEYLIGKFADVTKRKKAGEFYTPRSVVRMMVEILDPKEGESIYDPACGTGGMLLGAIEHVQRAGGDPRTFFGKIYGQEKNLTTSSIARMNLVLHGIEDFQIVREDTLRSPAFTDSSTGGLATFDCVIANPPFSLKEWGREVLGGRSVGPRRVRPAARELRRLRLGAAHGRVDGAPGTGRMAVVLPQGALFRKGAEGRIRQALLEAGPDRGGHRPGPEPLLRHRPRRLRRGPPPREARRAQGEGAGRRRLEPLPQGPRPELPRPRARRADRRLGTAPSRTSRTAPRSSTLDEIKAEDWTLNISRYVLPPIGEDIPPLPEAVAAFKQALAECARGRGPPARGADRGRLARMSKAPEHLSQQELESLPLGRGQRSCAA